MIAMLAAIGIGAGSPVYGPAMRVQNYTNWPVNITNVMPVTNQILDTVGFSTNVVTTKRLSRFRVGLPSGGAWRQNQSPSGLMTFSSDTNIAVVGAASVGITDFYYVADGEFSMIGAWNRSTLGGGVPQGPFQRGFVATVRNYSTQSDTNQWQFYFAATSLNHHIRTNVAGLLSGKVTNNVNLFIGAQWNTNNPCYPLYGITGIPAHTTSGQAGSGALLSRRHLISSTHAGLANGTTVWFVTRSNTFVGSTVVDSEVASGDILVILLQPDVEDSIEIPLVLTNFVSDALIPSSYRYGQPGYLIQQYAFATQQEKETHVYAWNMAGTSTNQYSIASLGGDYTYAGNPYVTWWRAIRPGDSGTPAWAPVRTNVVLLGTWYSTAYCTSMPNNADRIQTAMDTLSDRNTVDRATLSVLNPAGFSTY